MPPNAQKAESPEGTRKREDDVVGNATEYGLSQSQWKAGRNPSFSASDGEDSAEADSISRSSPPMSSPGSSVIAVDYSSLNASSFVASDSSDGFSSQGNGAINQGFVNGEDLPIQAG